MSKMFRIAVVAEGPTDFVVINSIFQNYLGDRSYDMKLLQPEESVAFMTPPSFGERGGGWAGVFKWCQQAILRSSKDFATDILFQTYDLFILHVDVDVAHSTYSDANINCEANDLPCNLDCPDSMNTVLALEQVILRWLNLSKRFEKLIICLPSKSMDNWVVAALYPNDSEVTKSNWECFLQANTRFALQKKEIRLKKSVQSFRGKSLEIAQAWPTLVKNLPSARYLDSQIRL